MFAEKSSNEYGEFLVKKLNSEDGKKRDIIFVHDYLSAPELHDDFCEKLEIFNYYAPYMPYGRVKDYDEEAPLEKVTYISMIKWLKDFVLSLNSDEVFLIGEGVGGTIALAVASLLPKKVKKLVLVNPYPSLASANTIQTLCNIPRDLSETHALLEKMLFPEPLLINNEKSPIVIKTMRNIYYNYTDLVDFALNMIMPKTLEAIKMYEMNLKMSTLLIIGDNDEFFPPAESILAYKSKPNIKVSQLPNSKHFPIVDDNKQVYIDNILKYFITDLGLNNETRLPNKYVYKYLSDDWKKFYRTKFAEKLSEREQKEYAEKLKEYEKENKPEIEIPQAMDESYVNDFVKQQSTAIKQMQDYVDYSLEQQNMYKKQAALQHVPDVYIDYSMPPNKIVTNSQGYQVYHDGKGNGFFKDFNGAWKPIIDRSKV